MIHVLDEGSIDQARFFAPDVDALLLDSGNPGLATKELGGTGRVYNWDISGQIVDAVAVPVFLSGGLNSENVPAPLTAVRPFCADVCSGLRTDDALDVKLTSFVRAVRKTSEIYPTE